MASQVFVLPLVSFFILFLALLWRLGWLSLQPFPAQAGKRRTLVHRLLKPRTPRDCPVCRLASPDAKPTSAPVRRSGGRWYAWPGGAHPNLSLSGLPQHVQCPTRYSLVSFENPFAPDLRGPLCAGRRARPFRCRTGLRLPTRHHHHLVDSCWSARTDLARALLLLPPAPPPTTGRTANQAPECQTCVVALASH